MKEINIILDTNCYIKGRHTGNKKVFGIKNEVEILFDEMVRQNRKFKVILPKIVEEEILINTPDNKNELAKFKRKYSTQSLKTRIHLSMFRKVLDKALKKEAPFIMGNGKGDTGFKDSIIWEEVLHFLKLNENKNKKFYFFSADGGFLWEDNKSYLENEIKNSGRNLEILSPGEIITYAFLEKLGLNEVTKKEYCLIEELISNNTGNIIYDIQAEVKRKLKLDYPKSHDSTFSTSSVTLRDKVYGNDFTKFEDGLIFRHELESIANDDDLDLRSEDHKGLKIVLPLNFESKIVHISKGEKNAFDIKISVTYDIVGLFLAPNYDGLLDVRDSTSVSLLSPPPKGLYIIKKDRIERNFSTNEDIQDLIKM